MAAAAASEQMDTTHTNSPSGECERAQPSHRLYNHALESIFVWLRLSELAIAMATCKRWHYIVGTTMKRIDAYLHNSELYRRDEQQQKWGAQYHPIVSGPLTRHVTSVTMKSSRRVLPSRLFDTFPYLQSFVGHFDAFPADVPIQFRTSLTSVNLALDSDNVVANSILRALATLPRMHSIALYLQCFDDVLSLESLRLMTQLEGLFIMQKDKSHSGVPRKMSHRFLDELRALTWLKRVYVMYLGYYPDTVSYVFRPPHALQWESYTFEYAKTRTMIHALQSLRHLTSIELDSVWNRATVHPSVSHPSNIKSSELADALQVMSPNVTSLCLSTSVIASTDMIRALSVSTYQLTSLSLTGLAIWDSFDCFTSGPLTRTLQTLVIAECAYILSTELPKLASLRALCTLIFREMIRRRTEKDVQPFRVPSTLIPTLRFFSLM